MKTKSLFVPVKKILKIVNSCQDEQQIENCKILIRKYIKSAKKNGLANVDDLTIRLNEELIQRQEALYLVKIFNRNV
jgi:hypothetical protein